MSDSHPNEVPELAHTDRAARRRELAAAGPDAQRHLDQIKQSLKLPNLVGIETQTQALVGDTTGCPERYVVRRLLTGADQRIQKEVFEQWYDGANCYRVTYRFGIQFTGYGSYCLTFERDPGNTHMIANFFRDVTANNYGVNLHRTMLFLKESYENQNTANLFHLLDGTATCANVNGDYLMNLERFVSTAKAYGVVVQVCLFMHHAVAASSGCDMPQPVVLSGTPHERYRAFCNTQSPYLQTQTNFIYDVVQRLLPHWNVVYEVGNELRVPNPDAAYNDTHLKAWIDWVAARIRDKDAGHLITVSTGIENEALVNASPLIQYCSFHQGQWVPNLAAACDRAKGYGNKHLVADDDGSSRELDKVKTWVRAALDVRGGCRGSFNHKGATLKNAYDPLWMTKTVPGQEANGTPAQVLAAFADARKNSSSPCARSEWE